MYDGKENKSFIDWVDRVEQITKLTQHLEIQLTWTKQKA